MKLTESTRFCGCGGKLPPALLDEILAGLPDSAVRARDDAGCVPDGSGGYILHTVDFFPPVCDDPELFGAVAAANALSDIYAMGGEPLSAVTLLACGTDNRTVEAARRVVRGALSKFGEAGCPVVGGHSVDDPEFKFGAAVTGRVTEEYLTLNSTARPGDRLWLSKPLGTGLYMNALQKGERIEGAPAFESMTRLNRDAMLSARGAGASAVTDVTGFGLAGHALEMARASGVALEIDPALPLLPLARELAERGFVPGAAAKNLDYVRDEVEIPGEWEEIVCGPETSGGLLAAAGKEVAGAVRVGRVVEYDGGARVRFG